MSGITAAVTTANFSRRFKGVALAISQPARKCVTGLILV